MKTNCQRGASSPVFDINSTNACKGAALLLLLWHHLFYKYVKYGSAVHTSAQLAKVCVAIFVILSGYGLSQSVQVHRTKLFEFYKRRLFIIYSNYWLIALIFIAIGVLFMNRPVQGQFANHPYLKLTIQLLGIHRFIYPEFGYNATWWYMSVIIPFIFLFPVMEWLAREYGILFLSCLLLILLPKSDLIPVLNTWLLPFALGIYLSQRNLISFASKQLRQFGWWRYCVLAAALLAVGFVRDHNPFLRNVKLDWLFGAIIILTVFEITTALKPAQKALGFLGKHLFNIFLFHTFIYLYYWRDLIYSFHFPVVIFLVLLFSCIAISSAIDLLNSFLLSVGFSIRRALFQSKSTIMVPSTPVDPHKGEAM